MKSEPAVADTPGTTRSLPFRSAAPFNRMTTPRPFFSTPFSTTLAALAAASLATAQGLLPTQGQVVVETGDALAALGGETVVTCSLPVLDRNGALLVRADLATSATLPADAARVLLVGHTDADLDVVVQSNQLDPSGTFPNSRVRPVSFSTGVPLPVAFSQLLQQYRISPNGSYVAFPAQLYDGGNPGLDGLWHSGSAVNDSVIYWGQPGALQILAQQNTTSMPGGAVLSSYFASAAGLPIALNSAGTLVFNSSLAGGDVGATNAQAVIAGTPGNLGYVVRAGDALLAGAIVVQSAFSQALNEAGQVLFQASLSTTLGTTPANSTNNHIIAVATPAGPGTWSHQILMRLGGPVPDSSGSSLPGVTYGAPTRALGFTDDGVAAFQATLFGAVTSADNQALFSGEPGNVKMVMRKGSVAPGTGGETFLGNTPESVLSAAGVLFGAVLVQPGIGGVNANNNSVLYLAPPGGGLQLLVREGDPCPGMPGFVFGNLSGSDNLGSSTALRMNDRGHVLFAFRCNDGAVEPFVLYSWDPLLGLQPQLRAGELLGGAPVLSFDAGAQSVYDSKPLAFNDNGDFLVRGAAPALGGSTANLVVRGHVGSLQATPSAVPVLGGTPQTMAIDFTPAYAHEIYLVVATSMGTDVGFPHPFHPALTVPLNFDPLWTDLSVAWNNSPVWGNTFGVLDANGRATASFTMPPGNAGFLGTTVHHAAALLFGSAVTEPTPCYLY